MSNPGSNTVNLSGILVMVKPESQSQVVLALNALEGVEVHQVDEKTGRIVVVQEADDIHAEIEGVKRIKAIPQVITMPPELIEQQDGFETCAVPAYLNS